MLHIINVLLIMIYLNQNVLFLLTNGLVVVQSIKYFIVKIVIVFNHIRNELILSHRKSANINYKLLFNNHNYLNIKDNSITCLHIRIDVIHALITILIITIRIYYGFSSNKPILPFHCIVDIIDRLLCGDDTTCWMYSL